MQRPRGKAVPPLLRRPQLADEGFNRRLPLPYGLKVQELSSAMNDVYDLLHVLNYALVVKKHDRLEELMLGNSFSGFISEMVVKGIAKASSTLVRNRKVGGHPDLLPQGRYANDAELKAEEGIEVKVSLQPGGWQGHNPEEAWVMIFQYSVDVQTAPPEQRAPFEFQRVMIAKLSKEDWSFSGRSGASRRTPTASILKSDTEKLHASAIYTKPGYIRARFKATLGQMRPPG